MPKNLKRRYRKGDFHFVTFSCCRRNPWLNSAGARNVFVRALGEVRERYGFSLVGYVVMPEHVHLLVGEPKEGTPSTVVHSLKLRVSKRLRGADGKNELRQFWEKRFYDFNVYSAAKRREKLDYMHQNAVKRGLVNDPKDWVWSSYSSYEKRWTPLIEIDFVN